MRRFCFLLCLFLLATPLLAAERVALVIGNAQYSSMGPLTGPANDARDLAAALGQIGFRVLPVALDLREDQMLERIEAFAAQARGAEVALLYYSGHGIQIGGSNYLLPVDVDASSEARVRADGVSVDVVLDTLRRSGAGSMVVMLDACRDNPIAAAFKSASKGLARMDSPQGFMIAYATAAGAVARDLGSNGRNSPYAQAVLEEMKQGAGVELEVFMRRVGTRVYEATQQQQFPATYNALTAAVVLAGRGVVQQPSPAVPAGEGELRIEVSPSGATVRLDGVLLGTGSRSVRQASGKTVLVRAEAADHEALEERVLVQGGQVADVVLRLKPLGGASRPDPVLTRPEPVAASSVPLPGMVDVLAGSFQMGSPSYEEGRESDEGPVRDVRIKAFRLGKYEVTRGEFARFVSATGYRTEAERNVDVPDSAGDWAKGPNPGCYVLKSDGQWGFVAGTSWRDPGFAQEDDHPVVCVSWNDARAYIEWLNRETGRRFRLPSEAEQEYAIRAGIRSPYAWGSDANGACAYANVADQSGTPVGTRWNQAVSCNDGYRGTSMVGRYRTNGFGLHDTVGNALEWGQDCYRGSYQDAPLDGRAVEANGCEWRVLRGAAWNDAPAGLRSANRLWNHPSYRRSSFGFRLAEDL